MVHIAKRSDRCPTHPGALPRDDVIPATGRTKTEIAQLLGAELPLLRSKIGRLRYLAESGRNDDS
jgi:hypothetical protein